MRLIDADALKRHYAWWGDTESGKERKELFDDIVDQQPTVSAQVLPLPAEIAEQKDMPKRTQHMIDPIRAEMLLFTERRKLANFFIFWACANHVAHDPESVIAYLSANGLLNEKECKKMIRESEERKA